MRDYTLVVYLDSDKKRFDEYHHVDVHGVREGCLYIHFVSKEIPDIIPLHGFYLASAMED